MAISNSAGGKGSTMRPFSVSREEYGNNHDLIFGGKKKKAVPQLLPTPVEIGDKYFSQSENRSYVMTESGWVFDDRSTE